MKYILHLSYDGTSLSGWQRQMNTPHTVQQELEDVFEDILHQEIRIMGCGRTDAGVHAAQYIAHFETSDVLPGDFLRICNHRLNDHIAIHKVIKAPVKFHARYDVIERRYDYFFHIRKDPFLTNQSAYYPLEKLDLHAMGDAISLLKGDHDFGFLCRQPEKHTHTICKIKSTRFFISSCKTRFRIQFVADRFLRGMVRIIVAKLIDVGRGSIDVETFNKYLTQSQERTHRDMAYPQGLYLSKINYPGLDFPIESNGFKQLMYAFNN